MVAPFPSEIDGGVGLKDVGSSKNRVGASTCLDIKIPVMIYIVNRKANMSYLKKYRYLKI